MARVNYGFADLTVLISHPSVGQVELNGAGTGNITFTMAEDTSSHNLAADGVVLVSKIEAKNGTVAVTIQQISEAHRFFTMLYNYLQSAPLREHAMIQLEANGSDMQVSHIGEDMSIQKRGDKAYNQQSENVTWTFLAAKLQEIT